MTSRLRRPRWLSVNGRLTSDPRQALRLVSAEVAAQRLQVYMRLRGWDLSALERFQLVPSPPLAAPHQPARSPHLATWDSIRRSA